MVRQFAIMIENRPGALSEVTGVLGKAGVNIESIMVEGVHDFGFVRIHASPFKEAENALHEAGFQFRSTEALVLRMTNRPGELHEVLAKLAEANINVGSLFGSTGSDEAEIVLDVEDVERAKEVLAIFGET